MVKDQFPDLSTQWCIQPQPNSMTVLSVSMSANIILTNPSWETVDSVLDLVVSYLTFLHCLIMHGYAMI